MRRYVLAVEAATVLLLCSALLLAHRPLRGLPAAAALTLCAYLHLEASRYAARARTGENRATQDLLSTWLFALVLVVSPGLAGAAPVLVDLYGWLRVERKSPVKLVFSTATTAAAAVLAGSTFIALNGGPLAATGEHVVPTLLAVAAAGGVFAIVNTGLVAGVVLLANPGMPLKDAFDGEPLRIEGVTLALAAVVAGCWVAAPVLVPLVLPALLLLQRSLRHSELLHEARTDAKTGLPHAVAWRRIAQTELERRGCGGRPLAVLLVDIDHFKDVNDNHGHLIGDQVLLAVAGCLTGAVRPEDTVGRFGGEEFAVVLPAADEAEAAAVAERLRHQVAELRVEADGADIAVTVSIGAAVSGQDTDVDALLGQADVALYAAKAAGRDLVVMAGRDAARPA